MLAVNPILMEKNCWWVRLFFGGHTGDNKIEKLFSLRENFQKLSRNILKSIMIPSHYASVRFATTTNCNLRTAGILKLFHESHQFITEDSAVGSIDYLQALASLTRCSSKYCGNFQKVTYCEYDHMFADNNYNRSVDSFLAWSIQM